jgi:hypothetical protein
MKNTHREITLPQAESNIERTSLLRILRRLEGDEGMRRRENSPVSELRRAVEWNLMGRPVMETLPHN